MEAMLPPSVMVFLLVHQLTNTSHYHRWEACSNSSVQLQLFRRSAPADKYESISSVHSAPCKYQNPQADRWQQHLHKVERLLSQETHWSNFRDFPEVSELAPALFLSYSRHFIEDISPVCPDGDGDDDLAQGLVHPAAGKRFQVSRGSSLPFTFSPAQPPYPLIFTFFHPRDG